MYIKKLFENIKNVGLGAKPLILISHTHTHTHKKKKKKKKKKQ